MSSRSLTYRQSDIRVKNIPESFTHKMAAKPAGIDIERNYVTVSVRIRYRIVSYHVYPELESDKLFVFVNADELVQHD